MKGAHIKKGHLRLEELPKKAQLAIVIAPILEQSPAGLIDRREIGPPKSETLAGCDIQPEPNWQKRHLRERLPRIKAQRVPLLRPRLAGKSLQLIHEAHLFLNQGRQAPGNIDRNL